MKRRTREFSQAVRQSPGLIRLTVVRWTNQFGDGFFQAALGGAILFNPERQSDPLAIAVGFMVLLLPYSLVGPFLGTMLDRWDRKTVLVCASVIRAVLTIGAAVVLLNSIEGPALLLIALAAVGVSRFMLAGLSASLPNIVARNHLVPTNSILVTIGAGITGLGAALSIVVVTALGEGDFGSGIAATIAVAAPVATGLAAWGFVPHALGPRQALGRITKRSYRAEIRAVAGGLAAGSRAVWHSQGVTAALTGLAAHRMVFGLNTLIMVLVLRTADDSVRLPGGLAGFGLAIAVAAAGMFTAAALMPFVIPRIGRTPTVVCGVLIGLTTQLLLVRMLDHHALIIAAFFLGVAGQTIKLTGDAAMQMEIRDSERGRVFALQDMVFNALFVVAIGLGALVIPIDGRSLPLVLAGAAAYGVALLLIFLNSRRKLPPHRAIMRWLRQRIGYSG
ncbi:MFS transporter [Hoyosella rhizosphaerae]|uniref:MFS-type transporter n=1 Tax=Hoyosella rhizosphaerae TaxID=1755582 RepID=A0A916XCR6_9ACTN|nr:MFS transporter [Hoyosella rhizosphaerae]GGC63990.1 putative MFS-type transporter [Hoyosella rhizosphaerae]